MLLSVVTGTYNRLEQLIDMVRSVRRNMPSYIDYEIILVDGGSTDGTIQWCKKQHDIVLVEQGELLGAIKAFDAGAEIAKGDYVIMGQDEVIYHPHSIMAAITHLETHPKCGAVAFMDNRPKQGGDKNVKYSAQMQVAMLPSGEGTRVIYAQIGLFRRWLGQECGWWGSHDEVMSQAKTYGGDNFLTSRIWELGYTVEIVEGCYVDEQLVMDNLREINQNHHDNAFYKRYPRGPVISPTIILDNPQRERLRILYLPIYEPLYAGLHRANKRGLREALRRRGIVVECDYLNASFDIPAIVKNFRPHVMLTQFHNPAAMPIEVMDKCRELSPETVYINWNGDARELTSLEYISYLKHFDLQLVVNASALPIYAQNGITASFWEIGYEEPTSELPQVPRHDVLFLGNNYNERRHILERALMGTGYNVGLYGDGWANPAGSCIYDFTVGEALYRGCKVAIGDTFNDGVTPVEAFVSNRVFQALSAGAFLLQERSEYLKEWTGLTDGEHYVMWDDWPDLHNKIKQYVVDENARRRIAEAGQKFVRENYNFDMQVKRLFKKILPEVRRRDRA